MKWVLIVVGALVALVGLAALAGAALPREHRASRSIELRQPSDSVWRVIRDFQGLPAWWSEMKQVDRAADTAAERWHQRMGGFAMTIEVAEDRPPSHLVTRIVAAEDAPFGGRWVYELTGVAGGTRVTVTEEGWIANPLFRTMARLRGLDATIKSYLRALGRRFGEDVK